MGRIRDMQPINQATWISRTIAALAACILVACGGGSASSASSNGPDASSGNQDQASSSPTDNPGSSSSTPTATVSAVTKVQVLSTAGAPASQSQVPLTFGQAFRPGDVGKTDGLLVTLADGSSVPYQVDVKARNADGSLRHAIISVDLAQLPAGTSEALTLSRTSSPPAAGAGATPAALLNAGFSASVNVNIGGTVYSASADALLASGNYTSWLAGPLVNEWLVSAPLKTAGGVEHPHLSARFAIRSYTGLDKARVDVIVENDWTYQPAPQNYTYDVDVLVGGKSVYSKTGLTHFHHARWRKVFWWGTAPQADVKHDIPYLLATRALPNYDTGVTISAAGLTGLKQRWDAKDTGPMGPGIVYTAMPGVGGRPDIGPLPQWSVIYLLSMDLTAKDITLGVGDLAGSWPIHYRDKTTGRPVSLDDHPYMTLLGHPGDAINPKTKQNDYFPACGGNCSTDPYHYQPDSAHEPSLAYLPYLVTGDHYYLEELQFWANWNILQNNPYYRGFEKGLVKSEQVRGQAWSLRTLAQTAYITPDDDAMKSYFVDRVGYNLKFYNDTYTNANPNQLGVLDGTGGFAAIAYFTAASTVDRTGIAPWQDDFFTWTVGYLADLGFSDAVPLLAWKAKFPVGRMTAPGYCWIDGATYSLAVRPNASSPLFSTLAEAYQATMRNSDGSPLVNSTGAKYLDQPCGSQAQADWRTQLDKDNKTTRGPWQAGEMTGYATSTEGFPSNMQPALAVAATSGVPNAKAAWDIFNSRPVKPDYSADPQWAVVPRQP